MRRSAILLAGCLAGCSDGPAAPGTTAGFDDVTMSLTVLSSEVTVGEAFEGVVTLENPTDLPAVLEFSRGCQVGILISNELGEALHPSDYYCTQSPTELTLDPHGVRTYPFSWTGDHLVPGNSWPLPPGRYTVAGGYYTGVSVDPQTAPEEITVRP